ncbi:MAG: ABC transporter permease [Gammaproteobacteria bacterium]|nr:ABC transporter permease [Gammaproteobacteria bacterium]
MRALMVKESVQIVRDPSSILIAFVLPLILLILFGTGVSLDANRIRLGVVLEDTGPDARSLVQGFLGSRFFSTRVSHERAGLEQALVAGDIRGILIVPSDFSVRLRQIGVEVPVQLITDGTQPNTAAFIHSYVQGIWHAWLQQYALEHGVPARSPITIVPRVWFNEELLSRNFLVPGSVAIIMTLIGTLLTALVIAREWERGTMEAMMATPIGRLELLVGKIVPYFLLGMGSMLVCTLVATQFFGVPLRGSLLTLSLVSAVFLIPALGQGYLISALTRSQFVASQLALMSGFLPAMLLSGFVFEIGSMPAPIQALTVVLPARYFVASLQTIFLAGDIWPLLWRSMGMMAAIGALLFTIAIIGTRKRLD